MEQNKIEFIKKRMIEIYNPARIYLFGSQVWGTPGPSSDIDICIILNERNEKLHTLIQKGTMALWDLDEPVDLIIHTKKEFEEKINYKSSLLHKIAEKGIIIYDAA